MRPYAQSSLVDADLSLKTHVTRLACLFHRATPASKHLSISFTTRAPVACSVSGSFTTGLRKCHFSRHPFIPTQTALVGDEFHARLVFSSSRSVHIIPLLCRLHWLSCRFSSSWPFSHIAASMEWHRHIWL